MGRKRIIFHGRWRWVVGRAKNECVFVKLVISLPFVSSITTAQLLCVAVFESAPLGGRWTDYFVGLAVGFRLSQQISAAGKKHCL